MSNLKTISQFKSRLQGGGARSNLFEVNINDFKFAPAWDNETFQFLCKAAQLPGSNVTPIEIPFRGRTLKVAGDRTFDEWTVTVINDEDFKLRNSFEQWMNGISKLSDASGATKPDAYMGNGVVHQLGRGYNQGRFSSENSGVGNAAGGTTGIQPLKTYFFEGIFPTTVSPIELSYENENAIEEFQVTFQVQYFVSGSNSASGSATDQANTVII
mgnify:FL=1|jgi:hypothetical protein|tara:strand:- start:298 stop:939 length:642 start_codon:yes stop_codon:yes gene_type:complete